MANFNGIPVYPAGHHPYGADILGAAASQDQADIVITLTDAWVLEPEGIPLRFYPWFPVDCEPIPRSVLDVVKKSTKGITISKFGQEQAEKAGLDTYYVPMGIDTNVYRRIDGSRERLGWPDKFIVGLVASNKTLRKSQLEQIAAFAALHKQYPDTLLYLHTTDGLHGADACNLRNYALALGLNVSYMTNEPVKPETDVLFCDQYTHLLGLPDPYMVDMYNSLDVLTSVSMGEGFGIPIVEAQACGCPVIVGDWTSMGELVGAGWKVRKDEAKVVWDTHFEAFRYSTSVEAVLERLIQAYKMRGNEDYRSRARTFSLQYDADKITEKYWKPVLADIESHLKDNPIPAAIDRQIAGMR
jgi:glycosyltransferase involved in cell wall biosynthesis